MDSVRCAMIVARAENGVIGRDGDLPWRLSADLRHFKETTLGKPIIMGRKTWESFPRRPLPKRPNIIVTRNHSFRADGGRTFATIELALAAGKAIAKKTVQAEVHVIGGAQIYEAALPVVDRIYLTEVHASPDGDTTLPGFDPKEWTEVRSTLHTADETNDHDFTIRVLERV